MQLGYDPGQREGHDGKLSCSGQAGVYILELVQLLDEIVTEHSGILRNLEQLGGDGTQAVHVRRASARTCSPGGTNGTARSPTIETSCRDKATLLIHSRGNMCPPAHIQFNPP
uniref:Uncharacterized protein n=1 Tax=Sphaerodactylus townsendi TaxID=933632 RepID=A0ACB8G5C9_9SAUR